MLYPEIEYFQGGVIDMMELLLLSIRKLYNQMIEEEKWETTSNYALIPIMEKVSKFHTWCLNADINNERMISVCNDMVTEGITILSDDKIDMHVVLLICFEFMEFMQFKYSNLPRKIFYVIIIRSDGE